MSTCRTERSNVRTVASNVSMDRVIATCSAVTISHAAAMGSRDRCGVEPCPPRPVTVTNTPSDAAISGPGAGGVQHPLLDHVARPVEPLLAGLEHEHDVAGQLLAPGGEQARGARE